MKKTKIIFWIFTGLFAALMLFSAVPDILVVPDAVTFMNQLGYPTYIIPFLGFAKLLGAVAILIPGFPRIKEWAYAGLFFDLIGAAYSQFAINKSIAPVLFMLIPIILGALSYIFYHKKLSMQELPVQAV
jgi:uncharacterized membrane protein YphA (DoxX/SURF4 family)